MYGPPRRHSNDGIAKPKSIKEVPSYLKKLIVGFFSRYAYIFKLVWSASPLLLIVLTLSTIFNGVFPVVGAYITAELLNELVEAYTIAQSLLSLPADVIFETVSSEVNIMFWIVLELVFLIVKSLINNIYNAITTISGEKVSFHIKTSIITKSKDIDLAQFDLPTFYEKLENATREASFRPVQIISNSFSVISSFISLISFIIVLATLSPFAPLVIILISLPAAIIKFSYGRKNFLYMKRHSKQRRLMEYYSNIMTNKDIAKEVRMFDLSGTFIGKFKTTFKSYFSGLKKLVIKENLWHIFISISTAFVNIALVIYVVYEVCSGKMEVGDYSFYSNALSSVISCVASVVAATATIYQGTLFIDNMMEFERVETKIKPAVTPALDIQRHIPHTIEFKDVSFSYPGTDRLVLDKISFKLEGGTTTVLVGLNGAGKTTLIKLLTRLYDPVDGVILLDGIDIRNYDIKQLYKMFGTIFQDFGKYATDIEENIYFGDVEKGAVEAELDKAAKHSGAYDFISSYPKKYKTPLTKYFEEEGTELSIGQWQKLSVSRAFYSDSDVLILDEPTAALDAIAEQQIFKQFEELTKGKTSIFVSHRLSSATSADKILVLENGKVVEEGSHKDLMELKGKYFELFSTQAKRYVENK